MNDLIAVKKILKQV